MATDATYSDPLATRYASKAMASLWSDRRKFETWRKLWIALAESERELGLKISDDQIAEMKSNVSNLDFEAAKNYEKRFRHDVMAHIHAFGDVAPHARGIIHLGATSCYVTDNADLILMRLGLDFLSVKLAEVIRQLAAFAKKYRDQPTLGFTHFQTAQPTTVGKRACLWIQDFLFDLEEIQLRRDKLRLRGAKGTTGTQASFLSLFDGDHEKCRKLDRMVAAKMGFTDTYAVTGQTYSRKIDLQIMEALAGVATSAHKFGTDMRLLAHRKEMEEPFEEGQIGSSAMPYKRNPMRSERICALSRYVMSLPTNLAQTHATQWLERTLDDSANRRLTIPPAFLGTDAILRLCLNVANGLVVYPKVIERSLRQELPFLAAEELLMSAVRAGHDRQEVHELIRKQSQLAGDKVKKEGADNDLIERLRQEPAFSDIDFQTVLDPRNFVGRAPQQVDEFLAECVEPAIDRFKNQTIDDERIEV